MGQVGFKDYAVVGAGGDGIGRVICSLLTRARPVKIKLIFLFKALDKPLGL